MSDVHLKFVNNNYIKIETELSTLREISDHFTEFANNYKYHPKFKNKMWDGKIRLVNGLTALIYRGLARQVLKFCQTRGYEVTFDDELIYDDVSIAEFDKFYESLNIPEEYSSRDYQKDSVIKCLQSKRRLLKSPTSSGKSLMIYLLYRWYNLRTLLIVPSIALVKQMASDFYDYGYKGDITMSTDGLTNEVKGTGIVISTWQSLDNGKNSKPAWWYEQFEVLIGDEAHTCQATQLIKIITSCVNAHYRFGTTGTFSENRLDNLTIEGLFGPVVVAISTREMIDQGYAADIKIKGIILRHPKEVAEKLFSLAPGEKWDGKKKYKEEVEYIINSSMRNNFIVNLTLSLKGNKLAFFRAKEHGRELERLFKERTQNVFYVDGTVGADEREAIRQQIDKLDDVVFLASIGTTSTGVSINKLHHMILAMPHRSKIKVLQSLGRMLRLHESKEYATLYDIGDDISLGKRSNMALTHFMERVRHYINEEHKPTIYRVKLK